MAIGIWQDENKPGGLPSNHSAGARHIHTRKHRTTGRQTRGGDWRGNDGPLARPFIHRRQMMMAQDEKSSHREKCQRYQSRRYLDLTRQKAKQTKIMC
ncbi:hypothetical protein BDA96_01G421200 [Sorghum bicolor]|uniref:Uncharacterized protein n=2 Tax=Sorghum bicolor TaxID=4558 RepID=A0A921V174_SORBI|nr:hypothetical protein BDA96_01G421200 [Sorghum bicolor]OQU92719.1 hypothetical protein SORBI_3001G396050 [Sorghum bicolor]